MFENWSQGPLALDGCRLAYESQWEKGEEGTVNKNLDDRKDKFIVLYCFDI